MAKNLENIKIKETFELFHDTLVNSKNNDGIFLVFKDIAKNYKINEKCKYLFIEISIEISSLTQIFFIKEKLINYAIEKKNKSELRNFLEDNWSQFIDTSYENFSNSFKSKNDSDRIFLECFDLKLTLENKKIFLKSPEVREIVLYGLRTMKYFI